MAVQAVVVLIPYFNRVIKRAYSASLRFSRDTWYSRP